MPDGTPLLLLHGALGSARSFEPIAGRLSAFETHAIDFEGHGLRPRTERTFRIQHFAENIVEYMDAQMIQSADIFGYSMGGYVALYLASTLPGRVRSVMTLATKFAWNPETAEREAGFLDPSVMLEKAPKYVAQLEDMHTGGGWEWVVRQTALLLRELGSIPLLNDQLLSTIPHRTRVMVGDRDAMVSIEETVAAYSALPNGELAVLPATPHPLDRVDAGMLARIMEEFFV